VFVTNTSRLSLCAPNSRASWTHCITHRKQRSGVSLDTQDCRLQRSHQVAHSPSPQCSNAEVYSVRDHRTRTMRQLLVLRSMRTHKRTIGFTKKPSSRTFAESSMLKRRGLLGARSPRTHNEAAFCALNVHTEADHRLQRSHQVEHSPSPQCSNAEVYSVHDHRTRTMRQLLVLRSVRTQGAAAILALEGRSGKYPRTPLRRRTPTCPRHLLATRSIQTAAAETMGAPEIGSHCLRSSVRDTGKLTSHY
jgi:hypothetical protein